MNEVIDDTTSSDLVAPSLRRRMACWIYEGLLLFGVVFLAGYLFSTLSQSRHALDNRHGLQAFLFLIIGLYFTWFGHKGQTLAMKTWRIRVVDVHGQALTQKRAFLRYVLSWVWFMPPLIALAPLELTGSETLLLCFGWIMIWALLSRFQVQKQFWHDVWAGTRLITSEPLSR
jgi:uncharacterized RDD family membrane protein YckC